MRFFKTVSFRLGLIAAAPLLFALILAGQRLMTAHSNVNRMDHLQPLAEMAQILGSYVHEVQKERGASGVFMGSKGTRFQTELVEQRAATDAQKAPTKEFLANMDGSVYGEQFVQDLAAAMEKIEQIDGRRNDISAMSITTQEALEGYSDHNATMLGLIADVADLSDDDVFPKSISAYVSLLQGKERAGIERAVM